MYIIYLYYIYYILLHYLHIFYILYILYYIYYIHYICFIIYIDILYIHHQGIDRKPTVSASGQCFTFPFQIFQYRDPHEDQSGLKSRWVNKCRAEIAVAQSSATAQNVHDGWDFCILNGICLFYTGSGFRIKICHMLGCPDPRPQGALSFYRKRDVSFVDMANFGVKILDSEYLQIWDHETPMKVGEGAFYCRNPITIFCENMFSLIFQGSYSPLGNILFKIPMKIRLVGWTPWP